MSDEKKDKKPNEPLKKIINDGDSTKSAKPNPPQKPPEGPSPTPPPGKQKDGNDKK